LLLLEVAGLDVDCARAVALPQLDLAHLAQIQHNAFVRALLELAKVQMQTNLRSKHVKKQTTFLVFHRKT
jgi:hypothetical protein